MVKCVHVNAFSHLKIMDDSMKIKQEVVVDDETVTKSSSFKHVKLEIDDIADQDDDEDEEKFRNAYDEHDSFSSDEKDDDSDYDYKRRRTRNSRIRRGDRAKVQGLVCRGCQRTFGSQGNLNKHLGHFKKCKKAYRKSGDLPVCFAGQKRVRINTGEEDFECEKCRKKFISEGGLNKHVSKIKACKRHYDRLNGTDQIITDGLTPRQSYYKRNREKVIARQREYYHKNAHKVKERRVQYYRSKIVASLLDSGESFNQKGTGYMERHRDYYEKNKETIKERRRNYYHIKKEALSRKVGKFEFAKISAVKNLSEIPDPFVAFGNVNFNIPPPVPPVKALKDAVISNGKLEQDMPDLDQDDTEEETLSSIQSPLENCKDYQSMKDPGDSKLDHEVDQNEDFITMPEGSRLLTKPFDYKYVQNVESLVGLTLSKDEESVEVCHLLNKGDIRLENLRKLIHALLSVISVDLKSFVQEKSCPVHLYEVKHMHLLKDKLTRDLLSTSNVLPETCRPVCVPVSSTETDFIDESMTDAIPHSQLLVNENLVARDLGAIGVQWRLPEDTLKIRISPLFSVNSLDHWRFRLRHLYTLLVNWVGGKVILNQIFHMLPCMKTAKESFFDEVRLECHNELLKPMETKICEHCGEVFQFSKYTLQTRRAYARHVQLHDHNCKICGENFPNGTQRKFHERSHKEYSVKCPHENCHYVGSSQQAVDTHVKHAHSTLVCDLCGKVTVAQNLKLHMATHHAPKTFEFICAICGKGYSTKNILDKHLKRHSNPDSLINKWMTEPSEFKFECKEHDNCKRFFKSEKRLKEHLRKYSGKAYPANLARQYVPNLPEDHSTIVDSTNIQMDKPVKKLKKLVVKRVKMSEKNKPLKKRKKEGIEEVENEEENEDTGDEINDANDIVDDTEIRNHPFQDKEEKFKMKNSGLNSKSPQLTMEEDNSTCDSIYQVQPTVPTTLAPRTLVDMRNHYQQLYPGYPVMNPDMYQQRTFKTFQSTDLGSTASGSQQNY